MTSVGPTPRRGAFAAVVSALALNACAVAGPEEPSPAQAQEAEEAPYLDGSLDGSGAPAGVEELILGEETPLEADGAETEEAASAEAGELLGEPLPLDEEIRSQFGTLFLDPTADVPPEVTAQVAEYVQLFHAGRARENFERWLVREGRYRDLILEELRLAGLPEELLYLSMLESGFNPTAVSRAKAVGLWQFMRATGRASGLRIDDWVDERRDPIASTRAAIGHLKMLHGELGDWALAAAAYNAGLGRVRRAQKGSRAGYFQLVADGKLPRETQTYVPLILAAGHVARHRERYGFEAVVPDPPHAYDTVEVDGRTRLSAVARVTGLPVEQLTGLNPHLVRGAAPPGTSYPLRVPVGTAVGTLPEQLAALPIEERILPEYREVFVTVKSGDSWWRIARAHGRTVKAVRALNPRLGEVIHPGQRVLVERQLVTDAQLAARPAPRERAPVEAGPAAEGAGDNGSQAAVASSTKPAGGSRGAGGSTYRVRPGDTMSELAVRLGVSLDDLARWNGMKEPRPLRAGETLRVAAPGPAVHRVASGETMSGLARRYGLTLNELVRLNGLAAPRPLRIGETLVVSAGNGAAAPAADEAPGRSDVDDATAVASTADAAPAATAAGPETIRHKVARGETLTSIARRYEVRIADLVTWNQLGRARPLREGETLVVRRGGADTR